MNRKERRRARLIFLFPLMFALTGFALLLLHWSYQFTDMDAFTQIMPLIRHNWYIVLFPLALAFLYVLRVRPRVAYVAAGIAAALFLFQLVCALLVKSGQTDGIVTLIPGSSIFLSIATVQQNRGAAEILRLSADACLMLTNLSAILTCLYYGSVKRTCDKRHMDPQDRPVETKPVRRRDTLDAPDEFSDALPDEDPNGYESYDDYGDYGDYEDSDAAEGFDTAEDFDAAEESLPNHPVSSDTINYDVL